MLVAIRTAGLSLKTTFVRYLSHLRGLRGYRSRRPQYLAEPDRTNFINHFPILKTFKRAILLYQGISGAINRSG